jgi:hypothetical protein
MSSLEIQVAHKHILADYNAFKTAEKYYIVFVPFQPFQNYSKICRQGEKIGELQSHFFIRPELRASH